MSLFFETIRIQNGKIYNLNLHQKRLDQTIKAIFKKPSQISLEKEITIPKGDALFRCKVIYDTKIKDINFYPYTPKHIEKIALVDSSISYRYKSTNRSCFEELLKNHPNYDDILIIKDDLLRDTTIANIALYDGLNWYTPTNPLLKGTYREYMIRQKELKMKNLTKKELKICTKFAIMNAMIGFKELKHISFIY